MPAAPGKPYTSGELKAIVDYLVEQRAYGQIRARKMWQEFADSGRVDRTWQSLKETFLKRILPDLHNPYYKLTAEQKQSFREGKEIAAKDTYNKLELRSVSEGSDTGDKQEEASRDSGENDKPSKMDTRSKESTDTIVLETCYQTAEDIARDLESPRKDTSGIKSPSKSLRDLITYSEPLTPMAQEVIDDFATDEDEPKLQIVEDDPVRNGGDESSTSSKHSQSSLKIRKSVRMLKSCELKDENNGRKSKSPDANKIRSLKLKRTQKGWKNQSTQDVESNPTDANKDHTNDKVDESHKEQNIRDMAKESGNKAASKNVSNCNDLSTDTQLPNNQEQLRNKSGAEGRVSNEKLTTELEKEKGPLKKRRLSSTDTKQQSKKIPQTKKQKIDNPKENDRQKTPIPDIIVSNVENTQTFDSHPNIVQNKTAQAEEETFNSHGNQVQEDSAKATAGSDIGTLSQNASDATPEAKPNNKKDEPSKTSTINPCLQSVSLYEEQFSSLHYSDSENEDTSKGNAKDETPTKEKDKAVKAQDKDKVHKNAKDAQDGNKEIKAVGQTKMNGNKVLNEPREVEELSSESVNLNEPKDVEELSSESVEGSKRRRISDSTANGLAKVFGFANAVGVSSKRPGVMKRHRKRRTISRNIINCIDDDSSYTSDSESEDLSRSRKQIPPQSYEILSHEGAEFVVLGRKLYPLMIRHKNKFHHALGAETTQDENADENYWKKRFYEEQLRADELARLLKRAVQNQDKPEQSTSPILPSGATHSRSNKNEDEQVTIELNSDSSKVSEQEKPTIQKKPAVQEKPASQEKSVKIKFNVNNEIELECHPNHVPAFLEKMKALMNGTSIPKETTNEEHRTPTPEVSEKVERIESEIFKEIAEKDVKDKIDDTNVTKRKRGRPRNTTSDSRSSASAQKKKKSDQDSFASSQPSTSGRNKTNSTSTTEDSGNNKTNSTSMAEDNGNNKISSTAEDTSNKTEQTKEAVEKPAEVQTKRLSRVPKKFSIDNVSRSDDTNEVTIPEDDPTVRYKMPLRSHSETRTIRKTNKKFLEPRKPRIILSPDNTARHSETSQGYQDSDYTPSPLKKKKKRSMSLQRNRQSSHVSSHPYQADVDTYDDTEHFKSKIESNKSHESSPKSAKNNSTLNTSEYRSESYQNLMPKSKPDVIQLEQIDENSNDVRSVGTRYFSLSPISVEVHTEIERNSQNIARNSSITSLPSPEISVVENLSISKEILSGAGDHPTLNEIHTLESMETSGKSKGSKYMMADVDVTVPLMEQNCEVRAAPKTAISISEGPVSAASETELPITDNAEEESSADSLDERLRNLLLESAKKMALKMQAVSEKSSMEIDDVLSTIKKVRAKRSTYSTSSKRLSRASTPLRTPVLDEQIESCSKGGRRSCPPIINVISCESPPQDGNCDSLNINPVTTKRGRQKDILKVKILKPKKKSLPKEKRAKSSSRVSVCTDSGINDTESEMLQGSNDSVELIHNHSETCLQPNLCIGESVEFVDLPNPVMIVSSDSEPTQIDFGEICNNNTKTSNGTLIGLKRRASFDNVTSELFCDNAQDATNLDLAKGASKESPGGGSNPSFGSINSLITEDLSDEESPPPKSSKWYLLSEEETTLADTRPTCNINANSIGPHSNLKQLFSSCAVPDLSTISEGSREDNSRRGTLDNNSNTY